jgi:hypothetical protein
MARTARYPGVLEQSGDDEARGIAHWRYDSLVRAGYGKSAALILAAHFEVDLHVATDLVSRGCPPATALRILL